MKRISTTILLAIAIISLAPTESFAASKKKYTIAEIIAARDLETADKKNPKYCQGGLFKPCVCPSSVTKSVQYRPAVTECGGAAAIILSGKYLDAYSSVVRDKENKDRWPPQGVNGCTAYQRDTLGLNKCSVFKVQKVIGVENDTADAEVQCLGASGYSTLFRKVSRITIKLRDIPGSNKDPLVRLCLIGPTEALN